MPIGTSPPGNLNALPDCHPNLAAGVVLLAATLVVILTLPAMAGPPLFDDHASLGGLLTAPREPGQLIADYLFTHSGPTGRPVAMATFIANALTTGSDLWYWKLTNLLIHLLNGLLIYRLGCVLTRRLRSRHATTSYLLPAAVACLWLLHPLHVSTVFYTVQRMTLLATFFELLALLLYLSARCRWIDSLSGSGWRLLLSGACGLLATFSKETGALLPLYLLVIEAVLFGQATRGSREYRWSGRAATVLSATMLLAALVLASRFESLLGGYRTRPFTLVERLLTESRVVLEYAALTLAPRLDAMSFFHDDLVLSTGPLSPPSTLFSLIALAGLAGSAWALRRRVPLYAIGIGFFLAGHVLESTVIPLHLMYEHRQYFPAFGLLLAVAALFEKTPIRSSIRIGSVTLFAGLCALLLAHRAAAWGDEWRLYQTLLEANPRSPGIAIIVGNSLAEAGEIAAAREILSRFDTPTFALNVAYLDCIEDGTLTSGRLDSIPTPDRFDFHERSVLIGLGSAALDGRCTFDPAEFIALTDRWLLPPAQAPHDQTRRHRAFAYARLGDLENAVGELVRLQAQYPQLTEALYLAASWLLQAGEQSRAKELAEKARAIETRRGIAPGKLGTSIQANFATAWPTGSNRGAE